MSSQLPELDAEWLEADGLGGFASGTVSGRRTRRYHAILLTARRPPSERIVLVNGFDAWIETGTETWALSTQQNVPGVRAPNGEALLKAFSVEPGHWVNSSECRSNWAASAFAPRSPH